ncbi:hypothetical protein [Anatilimnocola floriformis]|uniref:hypothetical protein n=1 Tax=Anatilimnocola floriformis TaxID=2948575 RepID=UPI0020C58C5B|nr:hypothetical protein [Anatilimnocola floriformis]
MNSPSIARPAPIAGEELRVPLSMAVGIIGMGFVALIFGGGIALLTWRSFTFGGPAGEYTFTDYAGWFGLFLGVCGLLLIPAGVLLLFNRGALVLGQDRLQYVVNRRKVITQIPYRNIARMEIATDEIGARFIGIELANLADPETYHPDATGCQDLSGWHYKIENNSPRFPLEQIYQHIATQANATRRS